MKNIHTITGRVQDTSARTYAKKDNSIGYNYDILIKVDEDTQYPYELKLSTSKEEHVKQVTIGLVYVFDFKARSNKGTTGYFTNCNILNIHD